MDGWRKLLGDGVEGVAKRLLGGGGDRGRRMVGGVVEVKEEEGGRLLGVVMGWMMV